MDEVAGYVRTMGEFVGRPVNASLMKRAGEAQAKIVKKIREWCRSADPESRLRTDGSVSIAPHSIYILKNLEAQSCISNNLHSVWLNSLFA